MTRTSASTGTTAARLRRRVTALAVAAAVGGFLFGFDSSVINGAVDAIGEAFGLGPAVQGSPVAVAPPGCAAGAYVAGPLAARLGRLRVILIGAVLFFASSIG